MLTLISPHTARSTLTMAHHKPTKKKIHWEKVIMALGFCSLLIGIFYVRTLLHQPPLCTTRAVHW